MKFEWTEQCKSAFNTLIKELCAVPTLQYPDPNKPFELFTDASHYCFSGILHQARKEDPEQLIPIAYFSGCFNPAQQNYNVTMKEAYVAYRSIQKFQFYLGGALCYLHCDHKPLVPFFLGNMKNPTLNRWALELNKYNIVFKHIAGKKNVVADAISRLEQKSLYAEPREISPRTSSLEDSIENIIKEVHHLKSTQNLTHKVLDIPLLRSHQKGDEFCKNMVSKLNTGNRTTEFDVDQNGILCRSVWL